MMRALMKRVVRGVRHDVEKSQFVCEVRRNNTAQMLGCLMYNINGGNMDLYFTHELRAGRGVARALCDEAFKYARTFKTCTFQTEPLHVRPRHYFTQALLSTSQNKWDSFHGPEW
ncbi:hypothetical protein H257_19124 [Aphanomyces astaci]|uniref:Uncharacterized protein n=1 Tax=Aphanomyces astaci TaxID=112090 RepID=W4FAJ4_APHAT|nr:hypothetical protein H257_19123 [Aphanomyces astaci]XP_009846573.1 hypothetical protein H257_19124 [Aphanomyces astaci]ETV63943.1 hypothetical protein H257_19123 [Aphanomyces astaci]ETV63944.1 hypothetical protein H257_19124 [Aphanomyces astaci]|eukprot:XP_009846572.1 hypothetical protein H257_19123 [Aphanomyces astaci]